MLKKISLSFTLLLMLTLTFTIGFASNHPLVLTVLDENGPIQNATVKIDDMSLTTNASGQVDYIAIRDGSHDIIITSPGRLNYSGQLITSESQPSQSILMTLDPNGFLIKIDAHTMGNLKDEINSFMAHHSLMDFTKIHTLQVVGGTMNDFDFIGAFHHNSDLRTHIKELDFSSTSFENNAVPGPWSGGFTNLKKIIFPHSVTTIKDQAFADSTALEEIIFPENLIQIEGSAFIRATSLKSLDFPNGLQTIGRFAFAYNSALENIYFKGSVTILDAYSFYNCSAIKNLHVSSMNPPLCTSKPFLNSNATQWIHVPSGSENVYRSYNDQNVDDKKWWNFFIEDPAAPEAHIIDSKVDRLSESEASVNIDADEPFTLYYHLNDGEIPNNFDTSGEGYTSHSIRTSYTLNLTGLQAGKKTLWVVLKDDFGNFSTPERIDIPDYSDPYDLIIINHVTDSLSQEVENFFLSTGIAPENLKVGKIKISGQPLSAIDLMGLSMFHAEINSTVTEYDLSETSIYNATLPERFFEDFYKLHTIKLPQSLTNIDSFAFSGCFSLEEVTFPSTIALVGESIFNESSVTKLFINATTPPTFTNSFNGFFFPEDLAIYVPKNCGMLYKAINDDDPLDELLFGAMVYEKHDIKVTNTTGGSIAVNTHEAFMGDAITLTVTPDSGNRLVTNSLTYNDGASHIITGNTFIMPDHDVVISALFESVPLEEHTLTLANTTGGSITLSSNRAHSGDTITLTVTPDSGNRLVANSLTYNDGASHIITGNTFIMPDHDVVISALFESVPLEEHTLTLANTTGGSITLSSNRAHSGDTITLTVTPDSGNRLVANSLTYNDGASHIITGNTFIMPDHDVVISALFEAVPSVRVPYIPNFAIENQMTTTENPKTEVKQTETSANFFNDTKMHWASAAINNVTKKGLFNGTGDGYFSPEKPMTRGMIMTVLGRLWTLETNNLIDLEEPIFKDTPIEAFYTKYINWGFKNNITRGINDDFFAPNVNVNREQLVLFIFNYIKHRNLMPPLQNQKPMNTFTDSNEISPWAYDAFQWALENNILTGKTKGTVDPKGIASRAEVATIIDRLMDYLKIKK